MYDEGRALTSSSAQIRIGHFRARPQVRDRSGPMLPIFRLNSAVGQVTPRVLVLAAGYGLVDHKALKCPFQIRAELVLVHDFNLLD